MPKTVIEKSQSPSPNVTVFSVSGTLGFHEKDTLVKLFDECKKRSLTHVVMDVAALTSLGGGCAKIIRAVAASREIALGISGAKATVLKFLQDEGQLVIADSVEDAASQLSGVEITAAPRPTPGGSAAQQPAAAPSASDDAGGGAVEPEEPTPVGQTGEEDTIIILGLDPIEDEPGVADAGANATPETVPEPEAKPATADENVTADQAVPSTKKPAEAKTPEEPQSKKAAAKAKTPEPTNVDPKELRKRIVQYNTLFSLNSDFYRIHDRKNLLELFLLTTIAQVGVESAVFLEYREGYFTPAAVRGLEADELKGFALSAEQLDLEGWKETLAVYTVESAPFSDEVKAPLLSLGCAYVAPFIAHNEFRGILALGRPIKSALDEGTASFLKILINQAAIAYESTQRFEEEKERTLGLVQTLIALIEENTLARGNTNLLTSYTHALAKQLHYPEEHIRDLVYGTVLRDIGMIKVSDLIVRSPRELMPEEWEIIKRHPIDGAEMLRKMRFSEHAVNVVISHHERFNGEGYPSGLQGKQIPLGARIVSIVESYAAMLQERPTRPALTKEEALNTLKENWGMRYDPDVVKAFVEIVENELRTGDKIHEAQFELFSV
jgi:HD-GYP domain-containing protein (c-di-GMP phosphodiesterase class II)